MHALKQAALLCCGLLALARTHDQGHRLHESSGDLGWHAGTFAVLDADGKTVGTGKYSEIWQKMKGKWMIIRDIWNNDAPAPAPTPAPAAPKPAE